MKTLHIIWNKIQKRWKCYDKDAPDNFIHSNTKVSAFPKWLLKYDLRQHGNYTIRYPKA